MAADTHDRNINTRAKTGNDGGQARPRSDAGKGMGHHDK